MNDIQRIVKLAFFLMMLIGGTQASAQSPTPEAAAMVQNFRAEYDQIMSKVQSLGVLLNNQEAVVQAQTGQNYLRTIPEADWDALAQALSMDYNLSLPDLTELSQAIGNAVVKANAIDLVKPQTDVGFPEFGPGYSQCPSRYDDPGFMFEMNRTAAVLGALMQTMQFVCSFSIPIPIIGGVINFAFLCIAVSIALGAVSVVLELMGVCRIINGRTSNPVMYGALVYPDNLLTLLSKNLEDLINANAADTVQLIKNAESELINISTDIKTTLISELNAAITAQQFSLVSGLNSNLSATENTLVATTTAGISKLRDEIVNHTKKQGNSVSANTDSNTQAIINDLDLKTQAILDNLSAISRETLAFITRVGCEDFRLDVLPGAAPNAGMCNSSNLSLGSFLQSPQSTSNSTPTELNAVDGGCSSTGSNSQNGNWLSLFALFLISMLLRFRFKWRPSLAFVMMSGLLYFSQADAQNQPTVEMFRAQYEEGFLNLKEYFTAKGLASEAKQIDDGLSALAQVTNEDLSNFFANVPPAPGGTSIPNFGPVVDYSRLMLQDLPPVSTQGAELLVPKEGFPPMGTDFCPSRKDSDSLYALASAKVALATVLSIMTWICFQQIPAVGAILLFICLALAIAASVIDLIYSEATNCAFLEGGPPTYEALYFITADIENQFGLLEGTEYQATNDVQTQLINTENAKFQSDYQDYVEVITNANAFIDAEKNYILSDIATSIASLSNTVVSTTDTSLKNATAAIKKNAEEVSAAVIANANKRAGEILAKASSDADIILKNARAHAEEVIRRALELGCANIKAETGEVNSLSSVPACQGLPGF